MAAPHPNMHRLAMKGALLGALVGDAAGATLEFMPRGAHTPEAVRRAMGMPGGGALNVAPGQITGVVGAVMIGLMLVLVPGLLADLPQPTLAAIIIAAAISLADIPASRRLLAQRRAEFLLAVVAFLGVVLLGVLPGIVLAIAMSVGNVFRRIWWPYRAELGAVAGLPGYHDTANYPDAATVPHCVLYRFDAPLIFANARTFRDEVRRRASGMAEGDWLIVAAEPMTDVDTTACDMLDDLAIDLDARGIRLVFAEMKDPVRRKLAQFGMDHALPADRFYPTLEAAVAAVQGTASDR